VNSLAVTLTFTPSGQELSRVLDQCQLPSTCIVLAARNKTEHLHGDRLARKMFDILPSEVSIVQMMYCGA